MPLIDSYAGIRRVALEIAYDAGFINRFCDENQWLTDLDPVIGADGVDAYDLEILDVWCMTLDDEQVRHLACGTPDQQQAVSEKCPDPDLCGLFEDIFNT